MKKAVAAVIAVALVATLVLAVPRPSRAGGGAEGALIATGVILFGQALGIFPTPRPFYHKQRYHHPRERVVIVREVPYYQPAPPRYYDPPSFERYWVPGHWERNRWIEGHWEQRPVNRYYELGEYRDRYEGPAYFSDRW